VAAPLGLGLWQMGYLALGILGVAWMRGYLGFGFSALVITSTAPGLIRSLWGALRWTNRS
jgi:hypothetical protein